MPEPVRISTDEHSERNPFIPSILRSPTHYPQHRKSYGYRVRQYAAFLKIPRPNPSPAGPRARDKQPGETRPGLKRMVRPKAATSFESFVIDVALGAP